MKKRSISFRLLTTVIMVAFLLSLVFTSSAMAVAQVGGPSNTGNGNALGYVPGELLVVMKERIDINSVPIGELFPGVDIVSIRDMTKTLPTWPQMLLIKLASDDINYMLMAIEILEQNPLVASAEFNGIGGGTSPPENPPDPPEPGYIPSQLIVVMNERVDFLSFSITELFQGVSIYSWNDLTESLPSWPQILNITLYSTNENYMQAAVEKLLQCPLVKSAEFCTIEKSNKIIMAVLIPYPFEDGYDAADIFVIMKKRVDLNAMPYADMFPGVEIVSIDDLTESINLRPQMLQIHLASAEIDEKLAAVDILKQNPLVGVAEPNLNSVATTPYDLTNDGVVDLNDLTFAMQYLMVQTGDLSWDEAKAADLFVDGVIDINDLIMILANYTIPYYS